MVEKAAECDKMARIVIQKIVAELRRTPKIIDGALEPDEKWRRKVMKSQQHFVGWLLVGMMIMLLLLWVRG